MAVAWSSLLPCFCTSSRFRHSALCFQSSLSHSFALTNWTSLGSECMYVCLCVGGGSWCAKQKAWWVRTGAEAEMISMSHQRRNNVVADGNITALWGSVLPPLSRPLSSLLSFCLHFILSFCFVFVVCALISNCLFVFITSAFSSWLQVLSYSF